MKWLEKCPNVGRGIATLGEDECGVLALEMIEVRGNLPGCQDHKGANGSVGNIKQLGELKPEYYYTDLQPPHTSLVFVRRLMGQGAVARAATTASYPYIVPVPHRGPGRLHSRGTSAPSGTYGT